MKIGFFLGKFSPYQTVVFNIKLGLKPHTSEKNCNTFGLVAAGPDLPPRMQLLPRSIVDRSISEERVLSDWFRNTRLSYCTFPSRTGRCLFEVWGGSPRNSAIITVVE